RGGNPPTAMQATSRSRRLRAPALLDGEIKRFVTSDILFSRRHLGNDDGETVSIKARSDDVAQLHSRRDGRAGVAEGFGDGGQITRTRCPEELFKTWRGEQRRLGKKGEDAP